MDTLPVDLPAAERLTLGSDELKVLATAEHTSGAMFAVEVRMPPGGGPPVMHRHAPAELYYVLDGEFTFYLERTPGAVDRVVARAGDAVPLPADIPHTIRNESDAVAIAISIHSPGEAMERFARAGAQLGASATIEDALALAQQHGVEMLGPIPAGGRS